MGKKYSGDEYAKIYGDRPDYGYSFNSKGGRLGKSNPLDESDISDLDPDKGNSQNLFIYRDNCCTYMNFSEGEDLMSGYWTCPICGKCVRESTPYHELERENDVFLKDWGFNDYDEFY